MEKQISEVFQEAKYDVFISYSRKDYVDERTKQLIVDSPVARLIEFFDNHQITYWFDKEGVYTGAQFMELIATAIEESRMMVFVSSKHSNASIWTAGEIIEAVNNQKPIIPLRIDDTPYSKKFSLLVGPLDHADYFSDSSASFDKLLEAINLGREDYERKLKEHKNDLLRRRISSEKEDWYRNASGLKVKTETIIHMLQEAGDDHKTCPVCGNSVLLSDTFCSRCGWAFVPPFEVNTEADRNHLFIAKSVWNDLKNRTASDSKEADILKGRIAELENLTERLMAVKQELKASEEKVKATAFTGHDYVNLGLPSGTLWATCNVGASKPSDYGDYFAWGETESKEKSGGYYWKNLKYRTDGGSKGNVRFSKYVAEAKRGTVDNRSVLELSDDAAHTQWGGAWRMPTHEEWVELRKHCDWKWTKQDGCNGYKVTSKKNGASIFLPAAGWRDGESGNYEGVCGHYWSSSLYSDSSYGAFGCFFGSARVGPSDWRDRYGGLSVRSVASSLQ